jgi:rhodanese-related sulfurtransferase
LNVAATATVAAADSVVAPARDLFDEVDATQALAAYHAGELFLDARLAPDYEYGHVPGALDLPIQGKDFEARLSAFLAGPKAVPGNPVVVYCKGCCSTDSLFLAQRLKERGFARIKVFRDGYPGWARANFPSALGRSPGTRK